MRLRDELVRRGRAALTALAGAPSPAPVASAAPPAPVPGGRQAAPTQFGLRSVSTSGAIKGITPAAIAAALVAADRGDPRRYAEMCEEAQDRDAHLVSVMSTRRRSVANLAWSLRPASDSPADIEIAEETERLVRQIPGLSAAMLDLLDGILTGYAMVEIDWQVRPERLAGRVRPVARPRRLEHRPARWFRPDAETDGWRVLDAADPMGVPLTPRKWIVHTPRAKTGFAVQAGLGRPALWLYCFKRYSIADWVTYNEKHGNPLRVGKYPENATPDDISTLVQALEQLGVDAVAAVPKEMDITFVTDNGAKTGADTFERFGSWADRQQSKLFLGQTLTTEEGSSGTQALGTVHNGVRADLRDSDAAELAETLTRDLIAAIVAFNWGAAAAVPQWVFDVTPAPDVAAEAAAQKARGDVFVLARQLGVPVSLAQVRTELGIREVEPGEAVLPPLSTGLPTPVFRALRRAHALAATPELVSPIPAFDGVVAAYQPVVAAAWAALVRELRAELGDTPSVEAARAAMPGALRRLDTSAYVRGLADATLTSEVLGRAQARSRDRAPIELPTEAPSRAPLAWAELAGLDTADWAARAAVHEARAEDAVRYALLRVAEDLLAGLAGAADVQAEADTQLERARQDARRSGAVVEGGASSAWSDARWDEHTSGKGADRLYFRYHIQGEPDGDKRVRPTHRAMAGRIYPATHPIWKVWRPPNGFGCRCWVTAHTRAEIEAAGWTITEDYPEVAGEPAVPDQGWQTDRAKGVGPDAHDWERFPADWRAALEVEVRP